MTQAKEKEPKHEQQEIEGFRPKKNIAVEKAFKHWLDVNGEWAIAKKTMNQAKEKLLDTMKEHDVPIYSLRGFTAKLQDEEKVLISKTPKEESEGDEDESAGEKE